jgi:SAM-dependent methyltransferase
MWRNLDRLRDLISYWPNAYHGKHTVAAAQVSWPTTEGKPVTPFPHRSKGYGLLSGRGMEIGAFHQPAPLPDDCAIEYCDAHTKEDAIRFFPELQIEQLVDVDHVCDLDGDGLSQFADESYDFIILNHVIEHVANPIRTVEELFRVVKRDGYVVISAPDKNFTFDSKRELTPFSHLKEEYDRQVKVVTDDHYMDFIRGVHPELLDLDAEKLQQHVDKIRARREHAHVWDSATFRDFLLRSLDLLQVRANCLYETNGRENRFEYFAVWQKLAGKKPSGLAAVGRSLFDKSRNTLRDIFRC